MVVRVNKLRLEETEHKSIDKLLVSLVPRNDETELTSFLKDSALIAHELPKNLRRLFYDFKMSQTTEVLIVSGYKIDERVIGPTPLKHNPPGQHEMVNMYEVLQLLFASLLGEPISWASIQNGYIFNDVMPVLDDRNLVASSGSDFHFDLHTEDAFHECAGDFLGLMCLRNPDNVKTVFSSISVSDFDEQTVSILFEPRFIVGANVAQKVPAVTKPSSILFGNRRHPFFRVNLNLIEEIPGDSEASLALSKLKKVLKRNCTFVNFRPGDFCYIDNYRVAHGREAFAAKFDGTDRWLKRLYVTSSFRNSASFRHSPNSRVINP